MGEGKLKESRGPQEAVPEITQEMIQTTLRALEVKGMIFYMGGGAYVPTESGWRRLTEVKPVKEEIVAYGHPKITATNMRFFKITKKPEVEKGEDAVIAVKANKACKDLKKDVKDALRGGRKVEIRIEVDGIEDEIAGYGSPALKLNHPDEIVVRKSDLIDSRTLAILADKSANEIKQDLIEKLRDYNTKVKIILEIKSLH